MVEGRAGQGEVLRGLQVGAGPDEGVVAGAPAAQCDAKGICGHDSGSFVSAGGLLLPCMRETAAAITPRAAETAKTRIRPSWNGPEMRSGKNSRPVSRLRLGGHARHDRR